MKNNTFGENDYSGSKYFLKSSVKSNIFRLDNLPTYPAADAYNKMIVNEKPKEIKHLFYDFSDQSDIKLMILSDAHWGSMTANFMQTIRAQLIAKYVPNVYLGYNGDLRNYANQSPKCASQAVQNATTPTVEMKLWYEVRKDPIIEAKTLFINTGNHENGKRNDDTGIDIDASFFAGTNYYDKYSRFTTLLTIRLKADNKQGFEDVVIYCDHGNSLEGQEGKQMEKAMKLAQQFGARIAVFGHQHKDYKTDYRIKKNTDISTGETIYDDLTIIELPAPMSRETYALEKRFDVAPSDIKIIHVSTSPNKYLVGSTQNERKKLSKTSVLVDCTPISQKLWDFGATKQAEMSRFIKNVQKQIIKLTEDKTKKFLNSYTRETKKIIKSETGENGLC